MMHDVPPDTNDQAGGQSTARASPKKPGFRGPYKGYNDLQRARTALDVGFGYKLDSAGDRNGMAHSTVRHLRNRFKKAGTFAPQKRGRKQKNEFTDAMKRYIVRFIDDNPSAGKVEIHSALESHMQFCNALPARSAIDKWLPRNAAISLVQRHLFPPEPSANEEREQQQQFTTRTQELGITVDECVFVGEMR